MQLIALYVFLAILAVILVLFVFLLFSPLSVRVKYNGGVEVYAGISFIKIRLVPGKEKKHKKKKGKKAKEPDKVSKENKEKQVTQDKKPDETSEQDEKKGSLKDTLSLVFDIVKSVLEMMGKKAKIRVDGLNVVVSKPDAADTAIQFGICNGLVSTFLAFTSNFGKSEINGENISVVPDFVSGKSRFDADITLSARTVSILLSLLKGYMKNQSSKNQTERAMKNDR